MAGAYDFPLLVELEENKLPRLKTKLIKYFQSKKSNGGDCEVEYVDGSKTAVVRFLQEEVQQNVLAKETHTITLNKGVLKMTVRLLPDEKKTEETSPEELSTKSDLAEHNTQSCAEAATPEPELQTEGKNKDNGDDKTEDEEPCSTSAVLGNVTEMLSQEFLEMLVENILKDADSPATQMFTLEVVPGMSSAVVTFQSGKENTNFISRCPRNRMFTQKGFSVQPLEVTTQVAVEDIQNLREDLLQLYFDNEGGNVENVRLNEDKQSAIITFEKHTAVHKVLKKKHCIKQKEIRVYPFYKSLGTALYGKDKPPLKLPAAVSEPIDKAVWRYLNDNQSTAKAIQSDLAQHFCSVNLSQSTVHLSPIASLLNHKDPQTIINTWKDTVKSAFAQAVAKFTSLTFKPESEVWEEAEESIRQTLHNTDVMVVPDKVSGVISVVGPLHDVNRLEQHLSEVVDKIVKRMQRQKLIQTKVIRVRPSIVHILCQGGLQDKLLQVYPELTMSFRDGSPDLTITGLSEEILEANKVIYDAMFAMKRRNLEIDDFVLDMLKDEEQEELTKALFTSNGINAAFEISGQSIQLLAVSDKDLTQAEDHLGELLISKMIDVEDINVLDMPEWLHLVTQLENTNSKACIKLRIHTTGQQVVVSGHKDSVIKVSSELDDFVTQNAEVEETVVVKPNTIVEYVKKLKKTCLEKVKDKVVVSYKKEAICLRGSRVNVVDSKAFVENLVGSVFFECFKVSKPGLKTFFQDKETMYVSSLLTETGCLVQLVDETGQDDFPHRPKHVYQLQTQDGVEIAVCKADMCSYPVDAVVNASNIGLKHDGGLALALLNAAGSQLQDECDKMINSIGKLKPGDCVITSAGGQLCCKKVIHAVGPQYDSAKSQKAVALLKRAVKESLELAEKHGCISVALPTISRSQNFPLALCSATIVKAVKEHCDENYDDNTLRQIHLVNNDDLAVQAMEAAVKKEFGNVGVSHSQQTHRTKLTTSQPAGSGGLDSNLLGQGKTKEGLDIILTKGKIEDAKTEVTVNTVFEDLALNKGAVSNAILGVAGPKLQQLVKEKNANANVGEIIVTDGCNLKSKQVFHAVTPHWDKGQGTSEKTLSSIFKDCLEKAEETGLTSISFPAIGTGNLGFPKDLVVSLILKEISSFSTNKKPKHLKKVVIVLYSGDSQTIQVFTDEFKKMFPNASVPVPASTSSPQNPGVFSKVVSSSGMHETTMGSVVIQLVTGDITKETTDVIVNSSNETFSLKSGVSKAILDAAGQAVEAECQNAIALSKPSMIMTQPGNLKCKKILHLAGQTDTVKINKVVKEALQMCVKDSHTSISFPAIGTGQGNVQPKQVADAMLDAVIEVLRQSTVSSLKTVRIVIFQPPMLKEFHSSMQQREVIQTTVGTENKGTFWGNFGNKIKSIFVAEGGNKPQKEENLIFEPLKVDPVNFHICGDTQANIDSAKRWINDLIKKDQTTQTISDHTILSFSNTDYQRLAEIQKNMSVSITIDRKNASLTIEGLVNVLKANNDIQVMLKKVREEEELKNKVTLTSTVVEWQYQQQGQQFQSFDCMSNFQLEQAFENNLPNVKVKVLGQEYTVTMPTGPATNSQRQTLQIKRIDKLKDDDIPDHWDAMPPKTPCLAVTITAGTPEHNEVLQLFQASCNRNVIKIERIQNPALWKSLQIKKRDMEQRNGHQNNGRRLFHGTCYTTVNHINQHGFNRSFAGKNAACYGNGTYFAVNASYSASNTYSKPNQNGEKFMYLCQVLTGDFTVGQQGMIVPPAKSTTSFQKFDSLVDRMANPSMFVIFHDSQACPEYLITFK